MCLGKHQEELRLPSLGEQPCCPAQETDEPTGRGGGSRVTARNPGEYSILCPPRPVSLVVRRGHSGRPAGWNPHTGTLLPALPKFPG